MSFVLVLRDDQDRDRAWLDDRGNVSPSESAAAVFLSTDEAVDAMLGALVPLSGRRWVVVEREAVPA